MASFVGGDASTCNNGSTSTSGILNRNSYIRKSGMPTHRQQYFLEHRGTYVDIPNEPILNNLASNKGLESELADPKKPYESKVVALSCAWEKISSYVLKSFNPPNQDSISSLIRWIHPITLQVVFHTAYTNLNRAMKKHMEVTLNRCLSVLKKQSDVQILKALIRIVQEPWYHPTLNKVFDRSHTTVDYIHNWEAVSLCNAEKAMTLAMRLEMLVLGKCDDFACKLGQVCMRAMELESCHICDEGENGDQRYVHFIIDVCIALLVKANRISVVFERLKFYDVSDGTKLVVRFLERQRLNQRSLWRMSHQVAMVASQYFLVSAMVVPVHNCKDLVSMMELWMQVRRQVVNIIPDLTRTMVHTAASSRHVFLLANTLHTQFGSKFTSLCIEFLIRGLGFSMNELEYLKSFKVKDLNNIREMEVRMSNGFLQLAELTKDNISVHRESLLTAFSLNPTDACYDAVKNVASKCGMITACPEVVVFNEECDVNEVCISTGPPGDEEPGCAQHSATGSGALCSKCGRFAKVVRHHDVQLEGAELLGISAQMCDDLIVILGSPRWHFLSWELDWSALSETCVKYLKEGSTRNTEIELKHLSKHIDYDQFKDWKGKEDEYPGIERGYEDCMLEEEEEEPAPKPKIRKRSRPTDSDSSYDAKKRGRKPKKLAGVDAKAKLSSNKKRKNLFLSSVSDYDTGTQDSEKTDATYSDGFPLDSPHRSYGSEVCIISEETEAGILDLARRKAQSTYVTRGSKIKKKQQERRTLATEDEQQLDELKNEAVAMCQVPNPNTLLMADKNGKTFSADLARVIPYNGQRVSDPKTLQQLRMFRAKKPVPHNENQPAVKGPEGPAMFSSSLLPLVLLQRSDDTLSPSKKPLSSNNGLSDLALASRKTDSSKALFGSGNKPRNLMGLEFLSSVIMIEQKRDRELMDREILKAHVPGLNSLDLIVPPPLEATVHIVQLAQSVPTSSTEDNNPDSAPTAKPHSHNALSTDSPPQSTSQSGSVLPLTLASPGARSQPVDSSVPSPTALNLVPSSQQENSAPVARTLLKNVQHTRDSEVTVDPENLPNPVVKLEETVVGPSAQLSKVSTVLLPSSLPTTSQRQLVSDASSEGVPNESNSSVMDPASELVEPSAEGLPKFHQAFNKGSRSIYCQTNPSTEDTVKDGEESVVQASGVSSKPSPIPTDMARTDALDRVNIVMPDASTVPMIRVIRGSSQHATASMMYIGPVTASRASLLDAPSHFSGLSSSPAMLKPGLVTKDCPTRLHPFQPRPPVACVASSPPASVEIAAAVTTRDQAETSSDEEVAKSPVKTISAQATRVIRQVLQIGSNIHRSQLSNLQPIQNYPALGEVKAEESGANVLTPAPIASVSSSTLEQLLEFEGVLKQYTATSKMKEKSETQSESSIQPAAVTHAVPQAATANSRNDFPAHISCLKVPVSRIVPIQTTVGMSGNVMKSPTKVTKVVMVSSSCQLPASPTITLTTDSLTSACAVAQPEPGKSPQSKSSKSSKSKSTKSSPSASIGSKSSPVPKPQQKPQEDEQTAQRIYQILGEYAEQLRNSPDLNNKPAPRRRSNPPTNPSQSSKRKKSSQSKVKVVGQCSSIVGGETSPSLDDPATMGSEDSSSNMMLLSHVHDSPVPSHSADETLSITPSLESSTEGGNLKSVVTEANESQGDVGASPLPRPSHTLICSTVQGMLVKEAAGTGGEVKPVLVGSAGNVPIYMHSHMQRVLMQTLKGQKLIRVQQVSVPSGAGGSGLQGTTLVLRQMMQQSPAAKQPLAAGTSRVLFATAAQDATPTQSALVNLLSGMTPTTFHNQLSTSLAGDTDSGPVVNLPAAQSHALTDKPELLRQQVDSRVPGSDVTAVLQSPSTSGEDTLQAVDSNNLARGPPRDATVLPGGSEAALVVVPSEDTVHLPTSDAEVGSVEEVAMEVKQEATEEKPDDTTLGQPGQDKKCVLFSQMGTLCQTPDAENLSHDLPQKHEIASQDSNDSDVGFAGDTGGSLQHPTVLASMMTTTAVNMAEAKADCAANCLTRIHPTPEMLGISSDESNSCSTGPQDCLENKPPVFEGDSKQATCSEMSSSSVKTEVKTHGEMKQCPALAPGLTGLLTEQNTDSTGTSDIDSSENLTNPFGSGVKQGGRSLRRRCKTGEGQGLLVQLRKKPKQGLAKRPLPRNDKNATEQNRPFTEALLQKSLSEECEDLGVDRPSASELFPEADVFLELENTNSSQCFETMQATSCGLDLIKPVAMFSGGSNMQATEFSSSSLDGSRMSSPALSVSNSTDSKTTESNCKARLKPTVGSREGGNNAVSTYDSNSNDEADKEASQRRANISPHMTRSRLSLRASTYDSNSNDEVDNMEPRVGNSNPGSVYSTDDNDKELMASRKEYKQGSKADGRVTRSRASLLGNNMDSNSSDGLDKVSLPKRTRGKNLRLSNVSHDDAGLKAVALQGPASPSRTNEPSMVSDNTTATAVRDKQMDTTETSQQGMDKSRQDGVGVFSHNCSVSPRSSASVCEKKTTERVPASRHGVATVSRHETRSRSLSRQNSDSSSVDNVTTETISRQDSATQSRARSLSGNSSASACSDSMDARDALDLNLLEQVPVKLSPLHTGCESYLSNLSTDGAEHIKVEVDHDETATAQQSVVTADSSANKIISVSSRSSTSFEVKCDPGVECVGSNNVVKAEDDCKVETWNEDKRECAQSPVAFARSHDITQRPVKQYRAKAKAKPEKCVATATYTALKDEDLNGCSSVPQPTRLEPVNGGSNNARTPAVCDDPILDSSTLPKMVLQIQRKLAMNTSLFELPMREVRSTLTGTSSSSEDSMPLPDPYVTKSVKSSEVTIPSPAMLLSLDAQEDGDRMESCGVSIVTLAKTSSAHKYLHTYKRKGKRPTEEQVSGGKKARLEEPGQYANVDSEETWESCSSRDKDGADDEDSSSHCHTELSSEPSPASDHTTDDLEQSSSVVSRDNGVQACGDVSTDRAERTQLEQDQARVGFMKEQLKSRKRCLPSMFDRSSLRSSKRSRMRSYSLPEAMATINEEDMAASPAELTLDESDAEHVDVSRKLRRSSLRGHVKKGCTCCNGLPETSAIPKKKDVIKVDMVVAKKSLPPTKKLVKCNNNRKR